MISEKRLKKIDEMKLYLRLENIGELYPVSCLTAEIRRQRLLIKRLQKKCRRYKGIIKDEQSSWRMK